MELQSQAVQSPTVNRYASVKRFLLNLKSLSEIFNFNRLMLILTIVTNSSYVQMVHWHWKRARMVCYSMEREMYTIIVIIIGLLIVKHENLTVSATILLHNYNDNYRVFLLNSNEQQPPYRHQDVNMLSVSIQIALNVLQLIWNALTVNHPNITVTMV